MRQIFPLASPLSKRRAPASLLTILAICLVAAAPSSAPAQDDLEADASRKVANVSWNPKTTFEEYSTLRKLRLIEFQKRLGAASLTDADKKVLLKHLQSLIYGLTVEQNVDQHHRIIDEITRSIQQGTTSPAVRDFLLENTLSLVEQLLKNDGPDVQPANVQSSLVLLVASLNSKEANQNARPPVPAQPYPETRKLLTKVLLDPGKPIAARITAVRGLERLMRDGDISTVNKSDIGVALAEALTKQKVENPLARKWYRWRLVDALGATGRYEETGYRPVMIDALMGVITNPKDDWEVRAAAARAVSQLPLDQKINVELVNYEIVQLLYDLANAYNASDKTPPSTWRWAFDSIYLAYKSATANDQNVKRWGLMHLASPAGREQISSAYKVVLPVVKPVLEQQSLPTIPAASIKALGDWLEKNKLPADKRKVTPQSPELPMPAKPPGAQAENKVGQSGFPGQ